MPKTSLLSVLVLLLVATRSNVKGLINDNDVGNKPRLVSTEMLPDVSQMQKVQGDATVYTIIGSDDAISDATKTVIDNDTEFTTETETTAGETTIKMQETTDPIASANNGSATLVLSTEVPSTVVSTISEESGMTVVEFISTTEGELNSTTEGELNSTTKEDSSSTTKENLGSTAQEDASSTTKGTSSSTTKGDSSSTTKGDVSSTTNEDISTTIKEEEISTSPTENSTSAKQTSTVEAPEQSEVSKEPKDEGMSSGIIALVMAVVFAVIVIIVYVGLLLWRRYLEYRYGTRELLVNDLEFDTHDLGHFEL